ncbi:hypothetical protein [Pseudomonas sp. UBA4194]|uniref:hypothetical protein n=1 Tax=Pseudomonas sp. UBA4194 TaxID=1947317 RepID=UPI0025F48503|nr:hypothetical protein [Pseudomonas sp. UBA4194]
MIDIDHVRKLNPAHGDVFQLPAGTMPEVARAFAEALAVATPGIKAIVFIGEIRHVDKAAMNAAGWYRA